MQGVFPAPVTELFSFNFPFHKFFIFSGIVIHPLAGVTLKLDEIL